MKKFIFLILLLPAVLYSQEWTLSNDTFTVAHKLSDYYPYDSLGTLLDLPNANYVECTFYSDSSFSIGFSETMSTADSNTYAVWKAGVVFYKVFKLGKISDLWIKSTNGGLININGFIRQW